MAIEIKVPSLGESVTEATVAKWFKKAGDTVAADEPLVSLETDKVALDVYAPAAGKLERIVAAAGTTVAVNALLGAIAESRQSAAPKPDHPTPAAASRIPDEQSKEAMLPPSVRVMVEEHKLDANAIHGSGKGGRLLKGDVLAHLERAPSPAAPPKSAPPVLLQAKATVSATAPHEERVPMSRLRRTIAERLKEAQNTAAILTTFNEVDMSAVIALRSAYREEYEKRHGVKLGFMSFFVKAVVFALKDIPSVNAQIDGADIVYKNHYDIGVAVSAPQGLVVPVLRDADQLGFADIEKRVADLAGRARDGKLTLAELQGGTFTITNGGVFGSLLSTPILNPPQSGILGMHKIQNRPVAEGSAVVVRPMMYVALSYDHRLVDGREAVTFLVRVKECIEAPDRLLLDV